MEEASSAASLAEMTSLTSPKAVPKSPSRKSPSFKSLSNVTVTVEASPCTSLSRALEGVTPLLHKSGYKASSAEVGVQPVGLYIKMQASRLFFQDLHILEASNCSNFRWLSRAQ